MKKFIFVPLITLLLVGCSNQSQDSATIYFGEKEFIRVGANLSSYRIVVDNETGVNYILINGETITPRYNQDGSLYVSARD